MVPTARGRIDGFGYQNICSACKLDNTTNKSLSKYIMYIDVFPNYVHAHIHTRHTFFLFQYGNLIYICIHTCMIHIHIHMTISFNDKKCSYSSKRKIQNPK